MGAPHSHLVCQSETTFTLRGLARQCEYLAKCSNCEHMLDFSQEVIQDQLIRGLNDSEIAEYRICS